MFDAFAQNICTMLKRKLRKSKNQSLANDDYFDFFEVDLFNFVHVSLILDVVIKHFFFKKKILVVEIMTSLYL